MYTYLFEGQRALQKLLKTSMGCNKKNISIVAKICLTTIK